MRSLEGIRNQTVPSGCGTMRTPVTAWAFSVARRAPVGIGVAAVCPSRAVPRRSPRSTMRFRRVERRIRGIDRMLTHGAGRAFPRTRRRYPERTMGEKSPVAPILARRTQPAASELVEKLPDGRLRCYSCGHRCPIPEGREGVCRVRYNEGGVLRVPWGYVGALQCDPIEKKPFFHALPGSDALSFGMLGCDLHCAYCQNWFTSQSIRDPQAVGQPRDVSAEELSELAVRSGSPTLVSTYN